MSLLLLSPTDSDQQSSADCQFDREAMMAMDFHTFDQTFGSGWRMVADISGCTLVAADLIRDYIDLHSPNERIIVFHEAQMRAKGGQTARAIELFRQTRVAEGQRSFFGWNQYVDATIAFLERDKNALQDARESLASLPKPSNFRAVDRDGNPVEMSWPPNLHVVDGFLECFEETYATAYDYCSGGD
ncbi:MAG: hypothetical protein QNI98_02495 [Woeseiaceae bacterium]|nr:hypothetical protein [Woeseiaceae bacterium]